MTIEEKLVTIIKGSNWSLKLIHNYRISTRIKHIYDRSEKNITGKF